MKKFLIFFLAVFLMAENLHIVSDKFFYDSRKMVSEFIGDVNATQGKDNILAKKMIIYFNKNKKPVKYIATVNVKFIFALDNNDTYTGHCDKLIYDFLTENIFLTGNAYIKRLETNESVSGYKIKIKDSKDLIEKLEILITTKKIREKLSINSRKKFLSEFSNSVVYKQILKQYET